MSKHPHDAKNNTKQDIEYKAYQVKGFDEIKGEITGYGVTYDNTDRVNDIVVKGALQESIDDFKSGVSIKFLFEHADEIMLNKNIIDIQDDSVGAVVQAKISDEAKVKYPKQFERIVEAFKVGNAYLSVGYIPVEYEVKGDIRHLKKILVKEFSFTTNPANMQARLLSLKSHTSSIDNEISNIKTKAFGEKVFRKYGKEMSGTQQKKYVSKLINIGVGIAKLKAEKTLDKEINNVEIKNTINQESPSLEARSNTGGVQESKTIDLAKVASLLQKQ
jgi:HK97 family phage prohead protease